MTTMETVLQHYIGDNEDYKVAVHALEAGKSDIHNFRKVSETFDENSAILYVEVDRASQNLASISYHTRNVSKCDISPDEALRMLLFPWVVPIFKCDDNLCTVHVEGVQRDKVSTSASARREFIMASKDNREVSKSDFDALRQDCLLYTSPSPRDRTRSRMPSSA